MTPVYMNGIPLVSSAYLPPCEYFAVLVNNKTVKIEREENFIKQTYRNRCYILAADGIQKLSVPVLEGSVHKTPLKELKIDNTRKWQNLHVRAIRSAYGSAPYFLYYFDDLSGIILRRHDYLLDLNHELLEYVLSVLRIDVNAGYTEVFRPVSDDPNDFRYSISPKRGSEYMPAKYTRVFPYDGSEIIRLSIIDLLFNEGPESTSFL